MINLMFSYFLTQLNRVNAISIQLLIGLKNFRLDGRKYGQFGEVFDRSYISHTKVQRVQLSI